MSLDNPYWYNSDMSLNDSYNYCKLRLYINTETNFKLVEREINSGVQEPLNKTGRN